MDKIIEELFKAFGPSIIVVAVAIVAIKMMLDSKFKQMEFASAEGLKLRLQMDQELRKSRETAYKQVWSITRRLPAYPTNSAATRATLKQINEELRDWYFDGGGMYLSRDAMDAYRSMQEGLAKLWQGTNLEELLMPGPDYENARGLCSAFRTELTNDLLSRQQQYFKKSSNVPDLRG